MDDAYLPETVEYVEAIFESATNGAEFAQWLHFKTAGHPYFMAFICRQYQQLAYAGDKLDATEHWHEIFRRLEKEKFSGDLAQVTEREVQLLRALARCEGQEINRKEFADYARIYFTRLTDKGLLIRTARGHYGSTALYSANSCGKQNESEQLQKRRRSRRDAAASLPPRPGSSIPFANHRAESIP